MLIYSNKRVTISYIYLLHVLDGQTLIANFYVEVQVLADCVCCVYTVLARYCKSAQVFLFHFLCQKH
jgi:hypothetical protein